MNLFLNLLWARIINNIYCKFVCVYKIDINFDYDMYIPWPRQALEQDPYKNMYLIWKLFTKEDHNLFSHSYIISGDPQVLQCWRERDVKLINIHAAPVINYGQIK